MKSTTLVVFLCIGVGVSAMACAADAKDIELRRLFEPTQSELQAEAAGRIYIYDGLRDTDVSRAMREEFERIESMMSIREKKTDGKGQVLKDPQTGQELAEGDGCRGFPMPFGLTSQASSRYSTLGEPGCSLPAVRVLSENSRSRRAPHGLLQPLSNHSQKFAQQLCCGSASAGGKKSLDCWRKGVYMPH